MWQENHTATASAVTIYSKSLSSSQLRASEHLPSLPLMPQIPLHRYKSICFHTASCRTEIISTDFSGNSVADIYTGNKPQTYFVLEINILIKHHISSGFGWNQAAISMTAELKLPSGKTVTAQTYWRTVENMAEEGTQRFIEGKGAKENMGV